MKNDQLKAGAVLSYFTITLGLITSLIYTPFMLRMLGQSEYGLYNLSYSIIGYLGVLDFGFGNTIIRYIAKYKTLGDKNGEYNLNGIFIIIYTALGIIAAVAGLTLVNNAEGLFHNTLTQLELHRAKIIMSLMVANIVISLPFGVFSSIIMAYERFVYSKIIGLARQILNPLIMIPLLFWGYKSVALTVLSTVLTLVSILLNVYYCFAVLKIKIRFKQVNISLIKEIFNYSFFVFLLIIVDKVFNGTDQFILGIVSGTTAVAIYSVGISFLAYLISFSSGITGVFLPKLTAMVTNNSSDEEISNLFIRIGRLQYIIIAFIMSGFILFGREFIYYWAGSDYKDSYYIALAVMIPSTVPLIQNLGISILQARNKQAFRAVVYICIAIFNVIISIPLAKIWGGIGAAFASGIAIVLGQIIAMNIYYHKKMALDIPKFWLEIAKMTFPILIAIGFTLVISVTINSHSIFLLVVKMLVFALAYCTSMWFWGMNSYEKELAISPLKKVKDKLYNGR